MDKEIAELESLFEDHFGRTPSASQQTSSQASTLRYGDSDDSASGDEIDESESQLNVDDRARQYLASQDSGDETRQDDNPGTSGYGENIFEDDPDIMKIREYSESGCGCSRGCSNILKESDIYNHILNVREMEKSDKELYIMATIVQDFDHEHTKRGKKRKCPRQSFVFQGKQVCKKTFLLLFDIGKHSLKNITQHVHKHGVSVRTHGNSGKKPTKSLQFDDIKTAVQFISNYAEEFGLPQPAAPRGTDNSPPIYLTCDTTKLKIHELYTASCSEANLRAVKYSTFNNIWRSCLAHIKIASPRDDVCARCEFLRKAQMDARTEEEKLTSSREMQDHIMNAQRERDVYNSCINRAKTTSDDPDNKYIHFTFDFCQNVCIPHHARQMGPLYFLTTRKIQIFGFRIDGIQKQVNFLVDENETIGMDGKSTHGPNAVISMVHWAMETYSDGETSCSLHADNCAGQNKNKYVLGYFLWRVMTRRHNTIEYMMQIPGHGRCLVDSGFASLKRLYRRSDCDSLDQLTDVVNKSSTNNQAVRYPTWQWRDWKAFLERVFRPLHGIRKFQYFRMSSADPGVVVVKRHRDAEEERINLLRNSDFNFREDLLPNIITPPGMSRDRQEYLYRNVRQYVRPGHQDATCPEPTD